MIARSWTAPLGAIATVAALAIPTTAQAQYAQTAGWVNLRAGPARDYPLVASLPPGTPITVQGCIAGYSWCDVVGPAGERGWIYAGKIVYPYQAGYVPVIQYGAVIGIPVVTFVIGSYWGDYYRHRPWYGSMHQWYGHRPPAWRPPPSARPPDWRPPPPRPRPPTVQPPRPEPPSVRPPPSSLQPPAARPRPPGPRPARPGDDRPSAR
jgi:uncharacterized protein YraI